MKKLTDYQAIIVDLDGTLYFQKPVRIAMLKEMVLHFWHFRDFLIVKRYRELYEHGLNEQERFASLPDHAPPITHEWMIDRPLPYVAKYKDSEIIKLLTEIGNMGKTVIVYSDYPVTEKLGALHFVPSAAYSAEETNCLKPDATGIIDILRGLSIVPEQCLIIGDRQDKDGDMARNMAADVVILPPDCSERLKIYEEIISQRF